MIVGVSGKAGSGKDTIGEHLVNKYGFRRDSLAAPIKRIVQDVFVLSNEEVHDRVLREQPLAKFPGWSVRRLLQYIGTEMFREMLKDDIWVLSLCWRMQQSDWPSWVVTDVRFPNEHEILAKTFGDKFVSIKVVRDIATGETVSGIAGHASEAYDIKTDHLIENNGTIEELNLKVDELMSKLRAG